MRLLYLQLTFTYTVQQVYANLLFLTSNILQFNLQTYRHYSLPLG